MNYYKELFYEWEDFYDKESAPNEATHSNENITNENQYIMNEMSVYIINCHFRQMNTASKGGAVSVNKLPPAKFLAEYCTFSKCSASEDGGSIFVYNANCVINKICGYECSCDNQGCFSCIEGIKIESNKRINNYLLDSSISGCYGSQSRILKHFIGRTAIQGDNISYNKCQEYSCFDIAPDVLIDDMNNIGSQLAYCSISNNTANDQFCMRFNNAYLEETNSLISYSNILYNQQDDTLISMYKSGQTIIKNTCIIQNNGFPLFGPTSANQFVFENCSVGNDQFTSISNNNIKYINSESMGNEQFLNVFDFIDFHNCDTYFYFNTRSKITFHNHKLNITEKLKITSLVVVFPHSI